MSDPSIEQELEANEQRAANTERAEQSDGIVGTIERAFPFVRDQVESPDSPEQAEEIRRENDAEQRG